MSKKIVLIVASLAFTFIAILFFKRGSNKGKQKIIVSQKPITKDLVQIITASGTLKAQTQITVGSLVAGRVEKIVADDNDVVKKDQVLAILDDGIGDTGIKRAEGALMEAKAIFIYQENFYKRQEQLFLAGQLAKDAFEQITQNYETSKSRVIQAEAQLEQQQKNYNNLFIKAPADGVVIAKNIDLGQQITAALQATVLFTIAKDLRKMEAHIDVDEADVGMVKEGQEAVFTVDAFLNRYFKSKVKQIQYLAKDIDNVVTYNTIISVDNKDLSLRPGMTTNVEIKVAESKNALCVPNKALRINGLSLAKYAKENNLTFQGYPEKRKKNGKGSLFVMEGSTIKEVIATLGTNDGRYTEIKKGIDQQSSIITEFLEPKQDSAFLKSIVGGGGIGKK